MRGDVELIPGIELFSVSLVRLRAGWGGVSHPRPGGDRAAALEDAKRTCPVLLLGNEKVHGGGRGGEPPIIRVVVFRSNTDRLSGIQPLGRR